MHRYLGTCVFRGEVPEELPLHISTLQTPGTPPSGPELLTGMLLGDEPRMRAA